MRVRTSRELSRTVAGHSNTVPPAGLTVPSRPSYSRDSLRPHGRSHGARSPPRRRFRADPPRAGARASRAGGRRDHGPSERDPDGAAARDVRDPVAMALSRVPVPRRPLSQRLWHGGLPDRDDVAIRARPRARADRRARRAARPSLLDDQETDAVREPRPRRALHRSRPSDRRDASAGWHRGAGGPHDARPRQPRRAAPADADVAAADGERPAAVREGRAAPAASRGRGPSPDVSAAGARRDPRRRAPPAGGAPRTTPSREGPCALTSRTRRSTTRGTGPAFPTRSSTVSPPAASDGPASA